MSSRDSNSIQFKFYLHRTLRELGIYVIFIIKTNWTISTLLDQCRTDDMESVAVLKVEDLNKASLGNDEYVIVNVL